MRLLHIDAFAGISGDMTVAALRDLGVPEEVFLNALSSLGIAMPESRFERGERGHISGWRFIVPDGGEFADHGDVSHHTEPHKHEGNPADNHHHHHHHHHHDQDHSHEGEPHGRTYASIIELLEDSSLEPEVRDRALSLFHRIALAEGAIHGVPPEKVGFHEVGAVDSIADIVCACAGFNALKIDSVTCGSLVEGTGHIHCSHGTFPLPAPATLALLKGIPLRQVEEPWEHITPTGAAIIAEFANAFGPMPAMAVSSVGYGLGTRDTPNRPNALRLILGETTSADDFHREEIVELRSNLDDMTPELAANAIDSLLSSGALDATLTPTVMKKGRSGWILEVLCHNSQAHSLEKVILNQTSTFGVRRHQLDRIVLERHHRTVETPFGMILVKIGIHKGEILQQSPEFSSCVQAAELHGVAVRMVYTAALQALT